MGLFRRKKMDQVVAPPLNELRKRTRILVIDDEEASFPIELLRREGYAIDYWPTVQNLSQLEQGHYDIIILDIGGVAQSYSKEDGLGILEHIKNANPSQIVVAFSGQSFDLSKTRFWKLADDSLGKPVDATKCKQVIDSLIEHKMTPQHYWLAVVDTLRRQGVSEKKILQVEDAVARAVARKDKGAMTEALKPILDNAELATRVITITCKIAAIFGW